MRRLLALIAAGLLATAFVAPASAGTAVMLSGVRLMGPQASVWCDSDDPFFPGQIDFARSPGPGSVSFMASDTMVGGMVTLTGARSNTRYVVRFIQATPDPSYWLPQCRGVDGYIYTNGAGNGSLYVRESRVPSAVALQFIIDTGDEYENPTYRAVNKFPLTPIDPYIPPPPPGPASMSRSSNHR